jgi:multidrug resistance efflux pump
MKDYAKYLLTGAIVAIAVIVVLVKYRDYVTNPWTRDGQVRANVVQVASRVSGPIVKLPILDNQFVKAGDLLFEIDPRTFEVSLAQARAQLDETGDNVAALEKQVETAKAAAEVARAAIEKSRTAVYGSEAALDASRMSVQQVESSIKELDAQIATNRAEFERQQDMLPQRATSQKALDQARTAYEVSVEQRKAAMANLQQVEASIRQSEANLAGSEASLAESEANYMEAKASLEEARAKLGAIGESNPQVRAALANVKQAELNLEFTQVRAPVDGYVTNLNLRLGTQAVAHQPILALVDVSSYWIHGFFRENTVTDIQPGDRAVVTLMTYPETPLEGRVDSLGWGIAQQDGSTGFELLPHISPTFEWIRLAQRVPVRIHLVDVPEEIKLRVGTTASVLVMTGTGDQEGEIALQAAPSALQ